MNPFSVLLLKFPYGLQLHALSFDWSGTVATLFIANHCEEHVSFKGTRLTSIYLTYKSPRCFCPKSASYINNLWSENMGLLIEPLLLHLYGRAPTLFHLKCLVS